MLSLRLLAAILWQHRLALVLVFVTVVAGATALISATPPQFVANSLSPARVNAVHVVDADARSARVIVPDFQLSLAIGKEGQNARLAARLTGWRIDIKSDEAVEEG